MSSFGLQYPDNATLFTGTLTTTGAGPAIDTTGYVQSVWQVSGNTFSGIITVENSLDGVYWTPTFVTELASLGSKSQIEVDGVYLVKADSRYIRYNVTNISGAATLLILGNNYLSSNPVDRLSLAMDETNNSPLNVKLQLQNSGIKQDLSGAFILSDAPQPTTVIQGVNAPTIIDTQGYQTISFTTGTGLVGTVAGSNDGITFNNITGYNLSTAVATTALAAVGNFVFPCLTRYIKVTASVAGQFTYYLRNQPYTNTQVNLQQIAGATTSVTTAQLGMNIVNIANTAAVTGGIAGTLAVGGTSAVGVAPANNPLVVGGVDPTGLARRATTTMLGDLITSNRTIPTSSAALSSATTGNTPIGAAGYNNQVPQTTQDTSQFEGQNQVELLAQILQEMKILNQQLYELPKILAGALQGSTVPTTGTIVQLGDEPTQMRNDASLFINQQ